nr:MAG TPA: 14-3-3 protein [Caudoviricetes sp.]
MISWLSVWKVKGDIYRYLSLKFYFLYLFATKMI